MAQPRDVLQRYRTVAVVGMSADEDKPAGSVPRKLKARGFRVFPVNPTADEIDGQPAYPSLSDVPEPVEIVEVFRPASEAPAIARQAVESGARALWLQLGLRSDEARQIAESAGLDYVEDHCMGAESARFAIRKHS
jgi:predicted CoA-binding protein